MFFNKLKHELMLVKSFQNLFCTADKKLKDDAKKVIAFLRDEAGARGELGRNGVPYFYDNDNRFDAKFGNGVNNFIDDNTSVIS